MKRLALLLATLAACHPNLPPVEGCRPGSYICRGDRPLFCTPAQRYEPAGDTTCGASMQVCTVLDGGVASCVPVSTTDGGAP